MFESIRTRSFVNSGRLAHADRTITEARQSLALGETSSTSNVICGQESSPLQQYHQETDEVAGPTLDDATRRAGTSPRGIGLRRSFRASIRTRSSLSISSQRSSTSTDSTGIAHWTNSFVLYTPVPPPRPRQPSITYQPVDTEPPSRPPFVPARSILDGLLPEESPVVQPDNPQLPGDTEVGPSGGVYHSPSSEYHSTASLDDDLRSSSSTSSDSDGPRTVEESVVSLPAMDQVAPDQPSLAYNLGLRNSSTSINGQVPENPPVTPRVSTARLLAKWPWFSKKKYLFTPAQIKLPVVVTPQFPGPEPHRGGSDVFISNRLSVVTTSEHGEACILCPMCWVK